MTRRSRREGGDIFPPPVFLPEARWEHIPGRGGEIGLRIIEPEGESRGVYLHFHGGGWVLGAADLQDPGAQGRGRRDRAHDGQRRLPPGAGGSVPGRARRLRGRGPLVPRALLGPRRAIGGESAGAQLAVVTLLRLRDRHGIDVREAFGAANLVFGPFDLTGTPSRHLWGDRELVLSSPEMDWFADCYLPGMPARERLAPDVSPLYGDLRDMPPALFTCGTLDPLLDDTLFMEIRWRTAGNETTLSLYPEAVHAFVAFETEAARRSRAEQYAFISG